MTTKDISAFQGPAWDNSAAYSSLDAPALRADLERAQALLTELEALGARLAPLVPRAGALTASEEAAAAADAQAASKLYYEALVLLHSVDTFASCELSVDGRNAAAKALVSKVQASTARLASAHNPVAQLLKLASDSLVERYLSAAHTAPERFDVTQERKLRPHALSLQEEDLLIGLGVDGPTAWGTLYDNLSGTIQCQVELPAGTRTVGLAEAASMSQSEDPAVRKAAFQATSAAWTAHEESVASVLNALAGWRLEVYRRRSHTRPMHFLDQPLHACRIQRATLDAMMTAVREGRDLGRRALRAQAKLLGQKQLAPWDLFAPCPAPAGGGGWKRLTFDEAIELIADAYATVHPEMGSFVRMMAERRWIEGRVGPTKRPGAYCTGFLKLREPRVYMTYSGGMREVKTLAHELGHAFHSWVMRDLPLPETFYSMTLAETASIFGETVVNGALMARAATPADRLTVAWSQAREVEALLLNIPARFDFETALYERRKEATLGPDELRQMMTEAWSASYGDSLSEMDPMFWASKLHFSISSISFYNFPYTFGYLFALGVYAQRARLGDKFFQSYVDLLRDTGRMTAEDLAAKHLGADLTRPDFWRQSLEISRKGVEALEQLA